MGDLTQPGPRPVRPNQRWLCIMWRMSKMSGDEYTAVLQSRLDEYVAKNPPAPNVQKWAATPLLEWFVRAGDEDLFEMD